MKNIGAFYTKSRNMKPKNEAPMINGKVIMLSLSLLFIIYVLSKPNLSSFIPNRMSFLSICNKVPLSLSESLVHYATTNTTPQQKFEEISLTRRVLENKSPCNFLIFGVGHDSLLWASLNHGGRTVFLEESKEWMAEIKKQVPSLEIYHVGYDTKLSQAKELLSIGKSKSCQNIGDLRFSECPLAIKNFPIEVYEVEWDLIMVDAPVGYFDVSPGRMKVIYSVGLLAKNKRDGETDVFVHDINRPVEDQFSKTFLCESYVREEAFKLRHFTIPSHKYGDIPFCP